jgi:hypothetical protein
VARFMLPLAAEADMEQKERIERLKEEVQRLAGNTAVIGGIEQLPPDIAEQFLERVIAVEKGECDRAPSILIRDSGI